MERPNDSGFYHHIKTEKFLEETCVAEIFLDDDHSVKNKIEFKYIVKDDGYADVIVTRIYENYTPYVGTPSDLRFDVLVAIGDRINRKINEISWQ